MEVRRLAIAYLPASGARVPAVDDVSIHVDAAEILGILGESGCGKTTLANSILQLLPVQARLEGGGVFYRGHNLSTLSEPDLRALRGRDISFVPQDPVLSLNSVLSAGSQISEVLKAHLNLPRKQLSARVEELLGEVGFDRPQDVAGAYPHQLSGGQRQRVVIAQAIACRPALIVADEPTSKLDAPLQTEIIALLAKIRRRHSTSMIVISHDPGFLAGLVDRVAVMYAGRIVEVGRTAEVFRRPLHPYTQALVRIAMSRAGSHWRQRFPAIEGDAPNPASLPKGCRFEPRCADRMEHCKERYPQTFAPEETRVVNCFKYEENRTES